MNYNVGDEVYVVSGLIPNYRQGISEKIFIEKRIVVKIGKYITLGISKEDTKTFVGRFIASKNPICDAFDISVNQVKNYDKRYRICFGKNEYTDIVFKNRNDAENFIYDYFGHCNYAYTNGVDYKKSEPKSEEVLEKYEI